MARGTVSAPWGPVHSLPGWSLRGPGWAMQERRSRQRAVGRGSAQIPWPRSLAEDRPTERFEHE